MVTTQLSSPPAASEPATRDAILDAVDRLLPRFGFRKMTVEDVAREAAIGKGTVYLHFRSKEEMVLARIDRVVGRLCNRMREIDSSVKRADAALRSLLVERVMFRFAAVQHYTESIDEVLSDVRAGLVARRRQHMKTEAAVFEATIRRGIRERQFSRLDVVATTESMLTATNGLLPYSLSARELGSRAVVLRRAEHLAALLVRGISR